MVMSSSATYTKQPFDAAIEFFRSKINLPTRTWKDLWQGMHVRAFVTAGAVKAELLADMRSAVDKAISAGTTLAEFRADFDRIVARHGWQYKGGRNWRSRLIYETNLAVAYAAGHWREMTDPDVVAARPYLRYVPSSSVRPRAEHMAWYNIVLPADDPWWQTHYPPNGWGCKCGVVNHSAGEVERLRAEEAPGDTPIRTTAPARQNYEWTDPATGEVHRVPVGIDPGWDYNVGHAAWGRRLSDEVMSAWRAQGKEAWQSLTAGDWRTAGRPATVPADRPAVRPGGVLSDPAAAAAALEHIIGGPEASYVTPAGDTILVNADSLVNHIAGDLKARSPWLPFLPELFTEPYEIWASFEKHRGTGLVVLRQRLIKVLEVDKRRAMVGVAQVRGGVLEAWTVFARSKIGSLKNERRGKLIYGR